MNPQLVELLQKFPGIGPKQATRFVYFLMRSNNIYKESLIKEINNLKLQAKECPSCYRYHNYVHHDNMHKNECSICIDDSRTDNMLMIVEKELDVDAIERTGGYRGKYFVLGGLLPFLADKPTELIKIRELARTVRNKISKLDMEVNKKENINENNKITLPNEGQEDFKDIKEPGNKIEIIYALPVTDEGDHTIEYLNQTLSQVVGIDKAKISILARGLSSGLDIEYVDRDTFFEAYKRRV